MNSQQTQNKIKLPNIFSTSSQKYPLTIPTQPSYSPPKNYDNWYNGTSPSIIAPLIRPM